MSASVGVSTHSEPHDSSRCARAIGTPTSLEALFVCREKRARAELLGRALLAAALLERLLRLLLLLLLWLVGTLAHCDLRAVRPTQCALEQRRAGPEVRILFAWAPTSRAP